MRRAAWMALLVVAGCAQVPASAPAIAEAPTAPSTTPPDTAAVTGTLPDTRPPKEFGWLGELVGSCWRGAPTESGHGGDTHCFMLQYGRMIRSGVKTPLFEAEAVFGIDLETQRPVYMQWASNGFVSPGDITIEGDTLIFINRTADGTPSKSARSTWRRIDPDSYRVRREIRDEAGGWKEFSTVDYHRVR